jgi:hypothetical protein
MSSTGHTTISPSNLQLIICALGDYACRMGIDFAQNPFAEELQQTNTPNDILRLLQEREKAFVQYRNRNRTLINCFSPAVRVLQVFSGKLGDAVGLVRFTISLCFPLRCDRFNSTSPALPSCKGCLCRNRYSPLCMSIQHFSPSDLSRVCQAASEVSSDHDDLLDLFERLGNFLKRLDVYIDIPPTEMMTDIIVKIMVELLSVLILAKKQIKRGRFSMYTIKYYSR